jgi:hypothetical protein
MLVSYHNTVRGHNPEDQGLNHHRLETSPRHHQVSP